jgi:RNA polymerase sigma-70 factor (ECF subfamily)
MAFPFDNDGRQITDTSTSLLFLAGQGDSQAIQQIVLLYKPLVHRWCCAKGCGQADSDDICQEVSLAIYQGLNDFQRERVGSFRRWIRQIAQYKIADHFRRRGEVGVGGTDFQEQVAGVEAAPISEDEEITERQLLLRQAAKLMEMEFSSTNWQAFYRSEILNQETATICQDLQISAGAFRVAKARVRKRLRELMAGLIS